MKACTDHQPLCRWKTYFLADSDSACQYKMHARFNSDSLESGNRINCPKTPCMPPKRHTTSSHSPEQTYSSTSSALLLCMLRLWYSSSSGSFPHHSSNTKNHTYERQDCVKLLQSVPTPSHRPVIPVPIFALMVLCMTHYDKDSLVTRNVGMCCMKST